MVKQGGGAIVNVASVNAFFQPDAGTIDYGAAKAALVNLTKSLRRSSGRAAFASTRLARAREHRPLARRRTASPETVAKATGVDPETARKNVVASIGGFATGRLHDARRGRHARRAARVGAHGQRHRRELRDRRRAHQDDVNARPAPRRGFLIAHLVHDRSATPADGLRHRSVYGPSPMTWLHVLTLARVARGGARRARSSAGGPFATFAGVLVGRLLAPRARDGARSFAA